MTTSVLEATSPSPAASVPVAPRKKGGARRLSRGQKVFRVFNVTFLTLFALVCLIPFLHVIGSSFAHPGELATRPFVIIPTEWTLNAYRFVLSTPMIPRSIAISIGVTVVGTALSLLATSLMAYALSKKYLQGRRIINFMVIFTMLFSGGMIPGFILVSSLGLLDSLWALILPGLIAAFNLILMRSFFAGIPDSLEEAARIDGCSELGVFWRIVLPLSMASLATIGLFYAVSYWNTYMGAILYLNKSELWPIQVVLRQVVVVASGVNGDASAVDVVPPAQSVKMAVITIATLPMLLVYPFVQRYFVKGSLIGSVKG